MPRVRFLAVISVLVLTLGLAPRADAAGLANVVAPSVSGTAQVGGTLTANPGQWTPTPTSYAYHWLRDGQAVAGATSSVYQPAPGDVGHALSVQVTASDSAGNTGTATSAATAPVAAGQIDAEGGQKVVGVARYTHTLTAQPGRFTVDGVTVRYQWRRNGTDIDGATGRRYAIRPEDVGTRLRVVVTASAAGYADLPVASPPTMKVGYRVDVRRRVTYSIVTRGQITTSRAEFATQAQQTYDDARGWRSSGIQFTRVAHGGSFTLVLAAAGTVPSFSSECSTMWSCRVGRYVIINQDRWEHASPAWNAAHLSLRDYRDLVINHETGHWLGLHDIYACPTPGRLAPVMMEQSKGIGRCKFNPWPLPREIASRTP